MHASAQCRMSKGRPWYELVCLSIQHPANIRTHVTGGNPHLWAEGCYDCELRCALVPNQPERQDTVRYTGVVVRR